MNLQELQIAFTKIQDDQTSDLNIRKNQCIAAYQLFLEDQTPLSSLDDFNAAIDEFKEVYNGLR
jgi:hypothetical protein